MPEETNWEKEAIRERMVKESEKKINKELRIETNKLKLQINSLLDINSEYAAKIAQQELLLERLPAKVIQDWKEREK